MTYKEVLEKIVLPEFKHEVFKSDGSVAWCPNGYFRGAIDGKCATSGGCTDCYNRTYKGEVIYAQEFFNVKYHDKPFIQEPDYWQNITTIKDKQLAKGIKKYEQPLEDNTAMTMVERIEYFQEEMIDGLFYMEHIKQILKERGIE